ncbi:MAG TPA: DUF192 domain-containing protein [Nitrososphaerales archaeon]|nr:DUF192 domain-containing protein [Nitrososphaerales archaeon]
MKTPGPRAILGAAVILAVLSYILYVAATMPGAATLANPPSSFTVNGRTFAISYTATDQSSRQAGLMNRKVTNATTMLFVFPSAGTYSFWMSNVNSSLDIIWLNVTAGGGNVVYVVRSAPPCSAAILCPVYQPSSAANWVLEAKGGFAEANGIAVGTTIHFG